MTGSKTNAMNRKNVLATARAVPNESNFIWHGKTEADRPATATGVDKEVMTAFRAAGPGWQTRMNAALKERLKTHAFV